MTRWATRAAVTEDARTSTLLDWVESSVRPSGRFCAERVIVFSEYRATQRYLQERLAARGIAGKRVELLDGTTDSDERERIKSQWQEPPADYPVRVLLATDAASEGISLQRHCHLLAHAEIPWNPNRLEQRNGRIDRHGQPAAEVLVHHCVSAGWQTAQRGSLEGDLDFLARVVTKVEQIREDLGSAGPVIAAQIEEAMLGRRATLDETRLRGGAAASRALLESERRMRERLAALRDDLHESRITLAPAARTRASRRRDGARARPPAAADPRHRARHVGRPGADRELVARDDRPRAPRPPGRAAADHLRPRHRAQPHRRRPRAPRPPARADGARAHARRGVGHRQPPAPRRRALRRRGARLRTRGRRARPPRHHRRDRPPPARAAHLRRAAPGCATARSASASRRPTPRWPRAATRRFRGRWRTASCPSCRRTPTRCARRCEARAGDRARQLTATLASRARDEQAKVEATLTELAATIRREAFGEHGDQLQLITGLELDAGDRRQVERDVQSLRARLDAIPREIAAEQAAIARRYAEPTYRLFPAAVTLLVPEGARL